MQIGKRVNCASAEYWEDVLELCLPKNTVIPHLQYANDTSPLGVLRVIPNLNRECENQFDLHFKFYMHAKKLLSIAFRWSSFDSEESIEKEE